MSREEGVRAAGSEARLGEGYPVTSKKERGDGSWRHGIRQETTRGGARLPWLFAPSDIPQLPGLSGFPKVPSTRTCTFLPPPSHSFYTHTTSNVSRHTLRASGKEIHMQARSPCIRSRLLSQGRPQGKVGLKT
jgi:hypothetical protein